MASSSLSLLGALPAQPVSGAERISAAFGLIALAPILVITLGTVRVLSGRAPLVAHLRVGQFGQPLWVFKIRTMWERRQEGEPGWIEYLKDPACPATKSGVDPRVTSRVAEYLRRHSIDELPQLAHIVAGTMRWIGPRPMTRSELDEHYGLVQAELLSVPPGLTGLWQVRGRNRLTYGQRRRLDLFLVRRFGWRLCVYVVVRTIKEVLLPRYAW
ncbi:MAG: sugar transferase [Bryobacteraceae bacterium]